MNKWGDLVVLASLVTFVCSETAFSKWYLALFQLILCIKPFLFLHGLVLTAFIYQVSFVILLLLFQKNEYLLNKQMISIGNNANRIQKTWMFQ